MPGTDVIYLHVEPLATPSQYWVLSCKRLNLCVLRLFSVLFHERVYVLLVNQENRCLRRRFQLFMLDSLWEEKIEICQ